MPALDPVFVTVSFEAQAIRDHFGMDDEMKNRLEELTDEQLYRAASRFLAESDLVWERFHEWCLEIVEDAEAKRDTKGDNHE
jgi:hypothetical protein